MDELRRIVEAGGKLVDARRDISRGQLLALGLFLDVGVIFGCLRHGGVDPDVAYLGGLGSLVIILLIAGLTDRR